MAKKQISVTQDDWNLCGRVYEKIENGMTSELKYNPGVQTIKTIINEAFSDVDLKNEADMKDFVSEVILEYGLQCDKNLQNEMFMLFSEISKQTKFYADFDEAYKNAVKTTMYKFYLSKYQKTQNLLKKMEEAEANKSKVANITSTETMKPSKLSWQEIQDIVCSHDTKSEKMRILYKKGMEIKDIRVLFDCKYSQVRNAVKSLIS